MDYSTEINISEKGKKTTKNTFLIQINSKKENWLGSIRIPHNSKQDFHLHYANLLDARGNVIKKFRKKDVVTRNDLSNQAFYQDDLISEVDLFWNSYPYKIEYSYSMIEEEYVYVTRWTPVLYTSVPTLNSSLKVNVPKHFKIGLNSKYEYQKNDLEKSFSYLWRFNETQRIRKQQLSPPISEIIPIVSITPINFFYGVEGKMDTWKSFGAWINNLNEGTQDLPQHEITKINSLVQDIADNREKIKTLYYYLQDRTHYVNVAIDVGGLKSYPASYVCSNKYGDCKALTTYMKAMLMSIGIESYYTIINAGTANELIDEDFPSQQFNHVILTIPFENDTIWLENTSSSLPFDYLGTFTQNRKALAVNHSNVALVKTPKMDSEDVSLDGRYHFSIKNHAQTQVNVDLTLRGKEFEDFRFYITNKKSEEQVAVILNYANIKGLQMNQWELTDNHRDSTFLRLKMKGYSPEVVRTIGSLKVIDPFKVEIPAFEKVNNRLYDVHISYPITRKNQSTYEIENITNYEVQLPKSVELKSSYGEYYTSASRVNDLIQINESLTLFENMIPLKQYGKFYEFLQSIIEYQKQSTIIIK